MDDFDTDTEGECYDYECYEDDEELPAPDECYNDEMDGDTESALTSAGHGMDESYGDFGCTDYPEDF